MALTSKTYWRFHAAYPIAALMLASVAPTPARADFFDDVRRTFQTDIPHFFQDDIPCAFGGQPTSHTKSSCRGSDRPAKQATPKNASTPPSAPTRPQEVLRAPPEYP
jgi:hypothetical protein